VDSPALKARLIGEPPTPTEIIGVTAAITEINGNKIFNQSQMSEIIKSSKEGDILNIKLIYTPDKVVSLVKPFYSGELKEYNVTVSQFNGTSYLGIFPAIKSQSTGIKNRLGSYLSFSPIKDLSIYYESKIGDAGIFIYYLFWWTIFINILVAIFNMVPASIFDGGRFFYLTILAITKKEKIAKKASKISAYFFLLILLLLLVKNLLNIFL
jgi:membrane-associated protease RseP (regulator of RpoE activity)